MTPDEANLRCLDGSVRNLIAMLCRHDGSVLRDCIPSTGTISGDLYATVASVVHNYWDHYTLSDLQRRYPLPKPVDAAPAGNDGGRELPSVPREVSDGGGSAVDRGVCGSADVEPPVSVGIDWAKPGADETVYVITRSNTAAQFEADLLHIINAAKERKTYTADMVRAMMLHCHSAIGAPK